MCCAIVSPEQELASDLHIAWSQKANEQFFSKLSGQVQQTAIKPAHAAFATSSIDCKDMKLGGAVSELPEDDKESLCF